MNTERYNKFLNKYKKNIDSFKKTSIILSIFRFLTFCILIFFIVLYVFFNSFTFLILFGIFLILFMFLIKKHSIMIKNISINELKINYILYEVSIIKGQYKNINEGGQYVEQEHQYCKDLDVFGFESLFQNCNRTSTNIGEQKLVGNLLNTIIDESKILERQISIIELKNNLKFRINFNINCFEKDKINLNNSFFQWIINDNSFLKNKHIYKLSILFPIINILIISFCLLNFIPWSFLFFSAVFQSIFFINQKKKIKKLSKLSEESIKIVDLILYQINEIENQKFKCDKLKFYQQNISLLSNNIKNLKKINSDIDSSKNLMVEIFFNFLFLHDIRLGLKLEKWKNNNKNTLEKALDIVSEFEVLSSFATYAYNNPDFIFPSISENNIIKAKNLSHPLIKKEERIGNDFTIDKLNEYYIVTGANMSGKSTFLRTIAFNQILAQNGMPVCADEYEFTPINIFTCMRYSDSISKRNSYFFSEVLRLKQLVDFLDSGKETLVIIDEMFNGTNSNDKTLASHKFIEKLITYINSIGIIATHDLSLTTFAEKHSNFTNLCFEIKNIKDQITYDYKLKNGITSSNNALILLKEMKIIEE